MWMIATAALLGATAAPARADLFGKLRRLSQQLRYLVSGKVAIRNLEKPLTRNRTEERNIAANAVAAKLEGMPTTIERYRIVDLVRVLRHCIRAIVTRIFKLVVVTANQRSTTQLRCTVCIHNTQICRDRQIAKDRLIRKRVTRISGTQLIHDIRSKNMRLAEIASVFGLTESRICQMHTKAVLQLRSRMSDNRRD